MWLESPQAVGRAARSSGTKSRRGPWRGIVRRVQTQAIELGGNCPVSGARSIPPSFSLGAAATRPPTPTSARRVPSGRPVGRDRRAARPGRDAVRRQPPARTHRTRTRSGPDRPPPAGEPPLAQLVRGRRGVLALLQRTVGRRPRRLPDLARRRPAAPAGADHLGVSLLLRLRATRAR